MSSLEAFDRQSQPSDQSLPLLVNVCLLLERSPNILKRLFQHLRDSASRVDEVLNWCSSSATAVRRSWESI